MRRLSEDWLLWLILNLILHARLKLLVSALGLICRHILDLKRYLWLELWLFWRLIHQLSELRIIRDSWTEL